MINLGKQSTVFDWIRLVFPYNFDVAPLQTFKSKSKNTIQGVQPLIKDEFSDVNDLLDVMGLPHIIDRMDDTKINSEWVEATALWGYDNAFSLGNIRVMFNKGNIDTVMPKTRADMGVAFEISGQGCRELEWHLQRNGMDFYDFFKRLKKYRPDMKVNRLDIAHDIKNGSKKLSPRSMRTCVIKEKIASRIKTWNFYENGSTLSGEILGETFSFGNSNFRLVVYDKLGERVHSHGDNVDSSIKSWTRWEMRLFYEYADAFISEVIKDEPLPLIYFTMLRQTMKVVEIRGGDMKNRSKAPEEKWWIDFTKQSRKRLNKIPISYPVKNQMLVNKHNYINKQVSKNLSMLLFAHQESGGDPAQLLNHWIKQGISKWTYDDVVKVKNLVQQSIDLVETKDIHDFVPKQLELNLTDEDYKMIHADLVRIENYFDRQF